ncbi:MFSD12 [Bugula neritina]|uniref:MFSD12 n=1 Tax=Bugula neritina TaxID=10212 RepID=A0A7J7J9I0_BUGNE|nr:MFSD12 [Bugula neritina]
MADSGASTPLPLGRKFSFGVGHVLNDLCASMWFTYLLIFYHKVIGMNNVLAGTLLLIGQVADAVATPLVGYESDRINGFCNYGKRKSWHLIGCICVAVSFSFIFSPVVGRDPMYYSLPSDSTTLQYLVYYAPFIVIFQFGWASTQISHLSLIPSLTTCQHDKVGLNSIRYAFTVISNLTVYLLTWYLLSMDSNDGAATQDNLAFIVIGTGVVFCIVFHVGTKEQSIELDNDLSTSIRTKMYVMCWLKTPQFYMVALLYMCTRLIVNLSQVYLSMYLTETLSLTKTYIAIVPLVIYISGFLVTFPLKLMSKKFGKKKTYVLGLLFVSGASVWFYWLKASVSVDHYLVMAAGALNGIGGSTILVLSLSLPLT